MKELHSQHDRNKANTAQNAPLRVGFGTASRLFPVLLGAMDSSLPRDPEEDFKHVFGSIICCLNGPETTQKMYTQGAPPFGACTKSGWEIRGLLQTPARTTRRFSLRLLLHKFAEDKNLTTCFPASSRPHFSPGGGVPWITVQVWAGSQEQGWPWTLPRTHRAVQRPQATKTCNDPKTQTTLK